MTAGTMDFTGAVTCLKAGLTVARAGWNGKDMWLAYVQNWAFQLAPETVVPADYHIKPFIVMKTADNGLVPWLASQTDILADDWVIVKQVAPAATPFVPIPEEPLEAPAEPIRTVRSNAK